MPSGGSAGSGKIGYPAYIEAWHQDMLENRMSVLLAAVLDNDYSPYTGLSAYNPSGHLGDVESRLSALKLIIDNVDPQTSWESYINSAHNKFDNIFQDESLRRTSVYDDAELLSFKLSELAFNGFDTESLISKADAISVNLSELDDFIVSSENIAKDFVDDIANKTWEDFIETALNMKNIAFPDLDNIVSSLETSAQTFATSLFDDVLLELRKNIPLLLNSTHPEISNIVRSIFDEAINLSMSSSVNKTIDEATEAYEESLMPTFYRSVNRFTAGLADVNAVHGSAFIIGLGLMESQHQKEINKFRSDIKLTMMSKLLDGFTDKYMSLVNRALQTFSELGQLELGVYERSSDRHLISMDRDERLKAEFISNSVDIMSKMLLSNVTNKVSLFDQLIKSKISFKGLKEDSVYKFAQLLNQELITKSTSKLEVFNNIFRGILQSSLDRERNKLGFISQGGLTLLDALLNKVHMNRQLFEAQLKTSALHITAENEQVEKDIELDVLDSKWPFDAIMYGGNLAGALGGGMYMPPQPTKTQTAISNALMTIALVQEIMGLRSSSSQMQQMQGGSY